MKYYLIVGEASGDLHASHLMSALKVEDPQAEFRFFGGDLMAAVGGTPFLMPEARACITQGVLMAALPFGSASPLVMGMGLGFLIWALYMEGKFHKTKKKKK